MLLNQIPILCYNYSMDKNEEFIHIEDDKAKKAKLRKRIIIIAVIICVFLITRAFWLWFWKVNALEGELELLNEKMDIMTEVLRSIESQGITNN